MAEDTVEDRQPLRTIDDVRRIEQVPLDQRLRGRNTYEILGRSAAEFGERTALVHLPTGDPDGPEARLTFAELFARVTQAANGFHALDVGPGDAVSLLLPNLPETHFAFWGAQAAGIANPINPLLEPEQIIGIMNAAETKVLVALGPMPGSDIWDKVEAVREHVPTLETVVVVGRAPKDDPGVREFAGLLDVEPDDRLASGREIDAEEVCALFHTGGTTGTPKLARHTHAMEAFEAWVLSYPLKTKPGDTLLCGLPLFHVNAVMVTGLAPFSCGATVVLLSPSGYRNPAVIKNFWRIVDKYKANRFSAVPTVYAALLQVPVGDADIGSLDYAVCGAAPMPVELFAKFEEATSLKILEGYGLTEGTCASTLNPPDGERRVGSIGLRFPYQPLKVIEVDEHGRWQRDCGSDEIGHIVISGPNVFPGYVQEEANENAFPEPGWFDTGDLGRIDADGYVWLTGRAKDVIIRGGHNIDSSVVEHAVQSHPAVAMAAAVGRPDAYAGELPVVYVQLHEGATADEGELKDYAREHVSERAAAPVEVIILDEMPLTAVGKVFKPRLRYDATRRVFESALREALGEAVHVDVHVEEDRRHGVAAKVSITGDPAARTQLFDEAIEALRDFAIKHDIYWST